MRSEPGWWQCLRLADLRRPAAPNLLRSLREEPGCDSSLRRIRRRSVRNTNEDMFVSDPETRLFAVADGMGGHNAGEIASRLAIEAIAGFIRRSTNDTDFSWPYGIDQTLSFDGNRLRTAIHLANRRVFRTAESNDDYNGMGTTIVGLLVNGSRLSIGNVGDSRLYLLSDGNLQQLTPDDSWAATLAQDASIGPEAIARHPMRNVLTNVLGAREQADIHFTERGVEDGEVMLLCTDGVHGVLNTDALTEILANAAPQPRQGREPEVRAARPALGEPGRHQALPPARQQVPRPSRVPVDVGCRDHDRAARPGRGHERRDGDGGAVDGAALQPARLRDVRLRRVRAVRRRLHDGGRLLGSRVARRASEAVEPVLDLRQQPDHDRGPHRVGVQRGRGHAVHGVRLERDARRRRERPGDARSRLHDVQTHIRSSHTDHRGQPHRATARRTSRTRAPRTASRSEKKRSG